MGYLLDVKIKDGTVLVLVVLVLPAGLYIQEHNIDRRGEDET